MRRGDWIITGFIGGWMFGTLFGMAIVHRPWVAGVALGVALLGLGAALINLSRERKRG